MEHRPECCCGCALAQMPSPPEESVPLPPTVGILGTAAFVPPRVVTNNQAGASAGIDDAWIFARTAIRTRRWADPEQATSDLAVQAAEQALANTAINAGQLGAIIVSTSTPDQPQPPTAAFVQNALHANSAYAFDTNAVCSGFLFAINTAHALAQRDSIHVLVIGADVYSRILDPTDRKTVCLFGDGAGAVVVGPATASSRHLRIVDTELHTFTQHINLIGVPGGGSRQPLTTATLDAGQHYFHMDGRGVRDFVTTTVPEQVRKFLARHHLAVEDIDHVVMHQANGRMLDEIYSLLDLRNATCHQTIDRFGNTGSASIPITLHHAYPELHGNILCIGFGGGMAAGITLLAAASGSAGDVGAHK
ncbi:3-oxoacyl-[acyl-carrier-protein] synthase 3 [Mycobacterium pseudoshottsii JCM 15466]|nr:Acetoacetyl CoA synthase NphT7 [Mycobacterium marinum]BBA88744.1 3-oxoacyl-[acyl-carrier-protein] synthase 3 [Mycobacterium pseudoshottsii JCM 15466]